LSLRNRGAANTPASLPPDHSARRDGDTARRANRNDLGALKARLEST
jgi:hypothetical protein